MKSNIHYAGYAVLMGTLSALTACGDIDSMGDFSAEQIDKSDEVDESATPGRIDVNGFASDHSLGSNTSTLAMPGGQIQKCSTNGRLLCDANGNRWKMKGVQFFLPQTGINGKTFDPTTYNGAKADVDWWLDLAGSNYLLSNTVRIFISLPGQAYTTNKETVNDFLVRAKARGMRTGITFNLLHSWTAAQNAWVKDLATYIRDKAGMDSVAYFNASNEINNNCSGTQDCFSDSTYANDAIAYVAEFRAAIRSVHSSVLITVGMASEKVPGQDLSVPMGNFFKTDASGRSLKSIVDFLSPHNYGGGAYGVKIKLRDERGYQGPIVLEEYGYPTDSKLTNPLFTEGATVCRDYPLRSECVNTAPGFVETNAGAIRNLDVDGNGYAGGVAWMLVDVQENSASCNVPFDFYTGLFTSNRTYCTGTYTAKNGNPKATAFRIRTHHYYW